MRLGGPIYKTCADPEAWAREVTSGLGYRAAYCPARLDTDDATVRAYADAARRADIVIAEVGAWSSPLNVSDDKARRESLARCKAALGMAERIGARCAVNVAGSVGPKWDGPDPRDLTEETFERVVQSVREIIDAVRPTRTYYTIETMPWMFPDSADAYLRLLRAVDRKAFGVHFDPANLVLSPQRYFENGALIRDFCARLGPQIRSCHAKDILLDTRMTVHLSEVRPGCGRLDYRTFLRELSRLDPDLPLMLEHLPNAEEYRQAAEHVRGVAKEEGVAL